MTREIKWAIMFDADGRFLDVLPLGAPDANGKIKGGRRIARVANLSQPELVNAVAKAEGRCQFLQAAAEVVALLLDEGDENETEDEGAKRNRLKAERKHEFFKKLLRQADVAIPGLERIANSLDEADTMLAIQSSLLRVKAKATDKVTVGLDGALPIESTAWHGWWRTIYAQLRDCRADERSKGELEIICLVSGENCVPERTHPEIRGVRRAKGTGAKLVSFDKTSFTSFGLERDMQCGSLRRCNERLYQAALEYLLRNQRHHFDNASVVYWYHGANFAPMMICWLGSTNLVSPSTKAHSNARAVC